MAKMVKNKEISILKHNKNPKPMDTDQRTLLTFNV